MTVTGRIVLAEGRAVPKPRLVTAENIKDADEWRPFAPLMYEETLVHADNRGVANVVVFLRPDSDDRAATIPAEAVHPDFAKAKPAERTVFASAGVQVAGDMPGLLRAAFREAAASGQLAIGGAKEDKLEVIAVGSLPVRDSEKVKGNVTIDLVAPRELKRVNKPNIKRNAPNGSIDLEIHWDED